LEVFVVLTIKISDELYEKYGKLNPQNPRYAIEKTLEKYSEAGYSSKVLVVTGEPLKDLQVSVGQIDSAEELAEAVKRALSVRVDGIEVPLTEGQRKRLESNAKFYNQPQDEYAVSLIVRALQSAFGV
jgi:hypothetical protein